jgi:hypothetical protein
MGTVDSKYEAHISTAYLKAALASSGTPTNSIFHLERGGPTSTLSALGWAVMFVIFPEAYKWPHLVAGIDLRLRAGAETGVKIEKAREKIKARMRIFKALCSISTNASGLEGWGIMDSVNLKDAYLRAARERPALGVNTGLRGEVSLDEARAELAGAISRILHSLFQDRYGPLVGSLSEPTITEILKGFEANLSRTKGDVTLVAQELLDRLLPPTSKKRR